MICQKCGKEIPNDSDFCQYCGKKPYKKIINVEIIIAIIIFLIIALLVFLAIFNLIRNKKIAKDNVNIVSSEDKNNVANQSDNKSNNSKTENSNTEDNAEENISNMSIDQIEEFDFQPEVEVETDESGPSWNVSEIYREYKTLLDKYSSEASNIENMEVYYAVTDINNDGVEEIIFSHGAYNADFIYSFYTFKNHKIIKIGQNFGSYSRLLKMNDGNYLKQIYKHREYKSVYDLYYENEKLKIVDREHKTLTVEEEQEETIIDFEKIYNGKELGFGELSNTEELNKLR